MNSMFILLCKFFKYQNMMKWIVILFLEFFTMYFEVQIMVIWNIKIVHNISGGKGAC
jgi:hypothetical protein